MVSKQGKRLQKKEKIQKEIRGIEEKRPIYL